MISVSFFIGIPFGEGDDLNFKFVASSWNTYFTGKRKKLINNLDEFENLIEDIKMVVNSLC